MRAIVDNKTLKATLTAAGQSPFFPLSNLQSTFFYDTYRSISNTGQRIVLDLASLQANYVYLRNFNFTSAVTIRLEGNNTDSWGSPAFSVTLTFDSEYIIEEFASQTFDFWSLYIDDPTNTKNYVELGGLILGQSEDLPGMAPDQVFNIVTNSKATFTVSGNLIGNEDIVYRADIIKLPAMDFVEKKQIDTIFRNVKNTKPILLIIWESNLELESPIYCNINLTTVPFPKSPKRTKPFATTLTFREVF